ncbi:MAG: hypothetical protein NTW25_07680 [Candidatus Kapabacteria bacterium]|nr:hypothetical protein [Candidatus Kapabacteria bacterium]
MKLISKLSILLIIFSNTLLSSEYLTDTLGIPKTYQRTKYKTEIVDKTSQLEILKQWDNTEKLFSKNYITSSYIKRNGNLESGLIGESINFAKETINGFDFGIDFYESYKFSDTNLKNHIMYGNNFSLTLGVTQHNYDKASNSKLDYFNLNTGFVYSRGYGWTFDEKSSLSLYKSLGLTFDQFYLSTTNNSRIGLGDYFESGVRYQSGKKFALIIGYRENLTHFNMSFENWALSKIIELGGNGVLDKFVTPILINKKYQYAPVYQFLYQSAWNYLYYSLNKSHPYFPFSNAIDETVIPDNRFVIGIKVFVYDIYR